MRGGAGVVLFDALEVRLAGRDIRDVEEGRAGGGRGRAGASGGRLQLLDLASPLAAADLTCRDESQRRGVEG